MNLSRAKVSFSVTLVFEATIVEGGDLYNRVISNANSPAIPAQIAAITAKLDATRPAPKPCVPLGALLHHLSFDEMTLADIARSLGVSFDNAAAVVAQGVASGKVAVSKTFHPLP